MDQCPLFRNRFLLMAIIYLRWNFVDYKWEKINFMLCLCFFSSKSYLFFKIQSVFKIFHESLIFLVFIQDLNEYYIIIKSCWTVGETTWSRGENSVNSTSRFTECHSNKNTNIALSLNIRSFYTKKTTFSIYNTTLKI